MPGLLVLSLRLYDCTTLTTDGSVPTDFSDVLCGILVPMEHQSAKRTGVRPHRKGFGNILSTATTVLTGITRTDFHYVFCGAFSLRFQNTEELPPADIGNRSGKMMVFEHALDAEAQRRFDELNRKRRSEGLTEAEQNELLPLIDQMEAFDVQRVQALSELAQLRRLSLKALMQELQIRTPAYA